MASAALATRAERRVSPLQDRPICFECHTSIDNSPIFEAPCGHDDCPSAVFHGACLMDYRDRSEQAPNRFEVMAVLVRPWLQEHTESERP